MGVARAEAPAPAIIVDPVYEQTSDGDVVVWASAPSAAGPQEPPERVVLDVGGAEVAAVEALEPSRARSAPSLALGIVFIRAKPPTAATPGTTESDRVYEGVKGALEGNGETIVYFTPFGSSRPSEVLRGKAKYVESPDIANSELYAEPPAPDVLGALGANVDALALAPERIKLLVVVTPGRDVAHAGDPQIATLAARMQKAGVAPVVVSFRPETGAREAAALIQDLVAQTGALHVDASANVTWTLASLSSKSGGVLGFRRFRFPTSGLHPLLGGTKALRIRAGAGPWVALARPLSFPPRLAVVVPLGLVMIVAIAGAWYRRTRVPWYAFLDELHAALQAKLPPDEAAERLSFHPAQLERFKMTSLDSLRRLPVPRYIQFRLPAAFAQLRALQTFLFDGAPPGKGPQHPVGLHHRRGPVGSIGLEPVRNPLPPPPASPDPIAAIALEHARRASPGARALALDLETRLPDEVVRLAGWSRRDLERWLDMHVATARDLDVPAARALITDAHALLVQHLQPEIIAWLVATSSAGTIGQVFRLKPDTTSLGWGADCDVRLPRAEGLAERHAELTCDGDRCVLRRLDGESAVRDQPVGHAHDVEDGDIVRLGRASFVFKIARG
jgi:hypothetical protein